MSGQRNTLLRRAGTAGVLVLAALVVALLAGGASGGGGDYTLRAIFDNASFVVPGEQVKVAGVNVGKITDLDVTEDKKAAVTMDIQQPGFADFRADAHCIVRPQSLIGEEFVECTPTQPKAPGEKRAPLLGTIPDGRPGAGAHLLTVQNAYGGGTSSPVGLDLLNDTLRMSYRQRLALIINELGTGLAGNSTELRQVIRRANPALAELDKVLAVLARENKTLARLAVDADRSLSPLARSKAHVSGFINRAGRVAQATAERSAALERDLELLPTFLSELRPTMRRLGAFSDQATPVLADLGAHAPAINRLIADLGPFSEASTPAFRGLGRAARIGGPALVRTRPLARQLATLGDELRPVARNARLLLRSFYNSGGIERAMDYVFFQTAAINGFDTLGHYLRAGLLFQPTCQTYATDPTLAPECSARFGNATGRAGTSSAASVGGGSAAGGSRRTQQALAALRALGYGDHAQKPTAQSTTRPARAAGAREGSPGSRSASGAEGAAAEAAARAAASAPAPTLSSRPSTPSSGPPTPSRAPPARRRSAPPAGGGASALLDYLIGGTR